MTTWLALTVDLGFMSNIHGFDVFLYPVAIIFRDMLCLFE